MLQPLLIPQKFVASLQGCSQRQTFFLYNQCRFVAYVLHDYDYETRTSHSPCPQTRASAKSVFRLGVLPTSLPGHFCTKFSKYYDFFNRYTNVQSQTRNLQKTKDPTHF